MMKKILSFSLSLAFILALSLPAFAASNGPDIPTEPAAYTVTVNEYDVYVDARNTSNEDLQNRGMSEDHIFQTASSVAADILDLLNAMK